MRLREQSETSLDSRTGFSFSPTILAASLGLVGGCVGAWFFSNFTGQEHPHTEFALKERFTTVASTTETMSDSMSSMETRVQDLETDLNDLFITVAAIDISAATGLIETRLLNLETDLQDLAYVPALGNHEETRAVIAFTSGKGQKTCPNGWEPFEPAKDRFIVGAGGKYAVVGTVGGEEEVTLSNTEMPAHNHRISTVGVNFGGGDPSVVAPRSGVPGHLDLGWYINGSSSEIEEPNGAFIYHEGQNQPHNNMPPYIALYFCQKT